jgi:hypothetical protein
METSMSAGERMNFRMSRSTRAMIRFIAAS